MKLRVFTGALVIVVALAAYTLGRHGAREDDAGQPATEAGLPVEKRASKRSDAKLVKEEPATSLSYTTSREKLLETIRGTGTDGFRKALEELLVLDDENLRREGMVVLATEWAKIDPRQAAESLAALASGEDRDRLLGHVVAIWTKSDPKKCLAWIGSAPVEEPARQLMKEQAYAGWAASAPDEALAQARETEDVAGIRAVLAMIAGQDFQRGLELAEMLSPVERAGQVESLVLIGAGKHHQEAAGLLAEYLGTKPAREDLARLGRTLLALDRPLAEQIVKDAANDSDRAYLGGKIFPPESEGIEIATEGGELMQDGDAAVANEAMEQSIPSKEEAAATPVKPTEPVLGKEATR